MPSLKDLAKECGVSVATVSKALNDQPDIAPATRERIRAAARRMGYLPNAAARALKTNRTYNLGVLFVDEKQSGLTHEYFSAVLDSFKVEAEKRGYDITFINHNISAGAESANYPFCTIDPNVGMVAVPDARLDKLAEIYEPDKKTPAVIEFVDIAGLVKGASQGAGLGNKFLANIRETDAIVHVVRCFDDENIMHVVADAGTNVPVDPVGDIEAIDMELIMADLDMVQRRVDKAQKAAKGDKKFLHEVDVFKALAEHLDGGKSARTFDCSDDDKALISTSDLLTLKPIIYAANMDEDGFANQEGNEYLKKVRALAEAEGSEVLPICAKLEQDIAELEGEDRQMFLDELGIAESGLDRLIKCSYSLLGLISFLTYGKDECRAWTIKKGTKAPQAAGKIHTDIERGFIRAEVIAYDDMIKYGGVNAAKEKGQLRSEGKEYVVQDGDMIYFRFNV